MQRCTQETRRLAVKILKNFPNYAIDKSGNVYSFKTKRYLKIGINQKGYAYYCLMKNKRKYMVRRNRLNYKSWKGKIPKGWTINHNDENKLNDNIENLSAMPLGENIRLYWSQRN